MFLCSLINDRNPHDFLSPGLLSHCTLFKITPIRSFTNYMMFCCILAFLQFCYLQLSLSIIEALHLYKQVLNRLAPFERGIFEDYVANFWCSTSVVIKWKRIFTIHSMKFLSLITTILAFLPSFVQQLKTPSDQGFLYSLLNNSFSFYLFSYQGVLQILSLLLLYSLLVKT